MGGPNPTNDNKQIAQSDLLWWRISAKRPRDFAHERSWPRRKRGGFDFHDQFRVSLAEFILIQIWGKLAATRGFIKWKLDFHDQFRISLVGFILIQIWENKMKKFYFSIFQNFGQKKKKFPNFHSRKIWEFFSDLVANVVRRRLESFSTTKWTIFRNQIVATVTIWRHPPQILFRPENDPSLRCPQQFLWTPKVAPSNLSPAPPADLKLSAELQMCVKFQFFFLFSSKIVRNFFKIFFFWLKRKIFFSFWNSAKILLIFLTKILFNLISGRNTRSLVESDHKGGSLENLRFFLIKNLLRKCQKFFWQNWNSFLYLKSPWRLKKSMNTHYGSMKNVKDYGIFKSLCFDSKELVS